MSPREIAGWNRTLFEAFVERARASSNCGDFERMLQSARIAGRFASRKGSFGELASLELENELLRAAQALSPVTRERIVSGKPRWLHVLTEAYGTLGHTNLCRRWIEYEQTVTHDVVLLDQTVEIPRNLREVVSKSGGTFVVLDVMAPFLARAQQLRTYAWKTADVVVLHTHPEDVIATTALGVEGGPPVILVNHADHLFWIGCSIADLVLDIRTSGHSWTKTARGVERATMLPLPLPDVNPALSTGEDRERLRREVRNQWGVPESATVFLTIGSAAKYEPAQGLDFLETAKRILNQCEDAYVLAVGPSEQGAWKKAKKASVGRIIPVGRQPSTDPFCACADVYLEGFPAGSLTACLEACVAGLALVRAPANCPPPFSSDGIGLDEVPQPRDVADYVSQAVGLAKDVSARRKQGLELKQAIQANYCRNGWLARLNSIKQRLPHEHSVYTDFKPAPVDRFRRDWLIAYNHAKETMAAPGAIAARVFVEAWIRSDDTPNLDEDLWARLRTADRDGNVTEISADSSAWNRLLPALKRTIEKQGRRARYLASARLAHLTGRRGLARRMVYRCAIGSSSSLLDPEWIRLFLKTHLSPKVVSRLR
jgi:hypothetical protein